jgi:hypothetical protein
VAGDSGCCGYSGDICDSCCIVGSNMGPFSISFRNLWHSTSLNGLNGQLGSISQLKTVNATTNFQLLQLSAIGKLDL